MSKCFAQKHLFTPLETSELQHDGNLTSDLVCAGCGVCADRLWQERSEGDGCKETGEPPLYHRAEG